MVLMPLILLQMIHILILCLGRLAVLPLGRFITQEPNIITSHNPLDKNGIRITV